MHEASGYKGLTKMHKIIMEHYSNIPMSAVKTIIAKYEKCAEKSGKNYSRDIIVRLILASSLSERR